MKPMFLAFAVVLAFAPNQPASASPLLDQYAQQAKSDSPDFKEFTAERGRDLFLSRHNMGKPETPSCTSCHTESPLKAGLTRAGKTIAPLAASASSNRYTDPAKVEKWFRRNCNSVLGRACTAREKGDFITFMLTQ